MPRYDYFCEQNGQTVEVIHSIHDALTTWKEVCERSGQDPGDTPGNTPVHRLPTKTNIAIPTSDSDLKQKGFTKLVRRDKGVYENVTRGDKEKRYFRADDPGSFPNIKKKLSD